MIPDNFNEYARYAARDYRAEKNRPKCGWCGNRIYDDHAYRIEGDIVCPECVKNWLDDMREEIDEEWD